MFTGIIEEMGTVDSVVDVEGARRIAISTPPGFLTGVTPGDSIAVDGACLTPTAIEGDRFQVEAVLSTLERTSASRYGAGSRVNLERALVMGGRLDGHLVQGHVDGLGALVEVDVRGETRFVTVSVPADVWSQTIPHGSIALNGISLTVNELIAPDRVQVAIIPHTWSHTNLAYLNPGDPLNVEGDLLGKYVGRILASRYGETSGGGESAPDR